MYQISGRNTWRTAQLSGADIVLTNKMIKVSEGLHEALQKGREIDVKGDDAMRQLDNVSEKIKKLFGKP